MKAFGRLAATLRGLCHRATYRIRTRIIADYHAANAARARRATEALVRDGWHVGPVPYGYSAVQHRVRTASGQRHLRVRLAVDPVTGPVVELIFRWRVHERLDHAAITRRLAASGRCPPPSSLHNCTPDVWSASTVRAILANLVYTGRTVWGRTRHGQPLPPAEWITSKPGAHPALVNDITFARARVPTPRQGERGITKPSATCTVWPGLLVLIAYTSSILAANLASTHWPALLILAMSIPAGTVFAGLTFTLRDVLHETFGIRGVLAAIALGTVLSWLLASPRIAGASVLAFTTSEILDSTVYAALRSRSRLLAVAGSNLLGLVLDTALFVPLAFGSFAAVPGQLVGKIVATACTIAVLIAIRPAGWAVTR